MLIVVGMVVCLVVYSLLSMLVVEDGLGCVRNDVMVCWRMDFSSV